ncbi:MAG: hypothetical protein R6U32_02000 [Candidatus Woesearchaeota archaeon]
MEMSRLMREVWSNLRPHIVVSLILRLLIASILVTSAVEMNLLLVFVSAVMLFATFLPSIITRRFRIMLPPELEITLSLFLFASFILGEMGQYYFKFWWWDIMLHSFAAFMLGLVGFIIIYSFYVTHKVKMSPLIASVFSFSFSLSLGALWEIFEFCMDYFFGFNMQKSGLLDTMTDMIVDAIGALVVAVLGFLYIKFGNALIISHTIDRFIRMNRIRRIGMRGVKAGKQSSRISK